MWGEITKEYKVMKEIKSRMPHSKWRFEGLKKKDIPKMILMEDVVLIMAICALLWEPMREIDYILILILMAGSRFVFHLQYVKKLTDKSDDDISCH